MEKPKELARFYFHVKDKMSIVFIYNLEGQPPIIVNRKTFAFVNVHEDQIIREPIKDFFDRLALVTRVTCKINDEIDSNGEVKNEPIR